MNTQNSGELAVTVMGWPEPGTKVMARDASGSLLPKVVVMKGRVGQDFPCLALARVDEWERAQAEDDAADWVPWPIEDVFTQ